MKQQLTVFTLFALTVFSSSAFIFKSSNGIAGQTGSPGEATCGACHGGGNSDSTGVNISAVPSFSNGLYKPDALYKISVQVFAKGYSRFGFGLEILDSLNNNAGTMQGAGPGVKFLNAFQRRNAVQINPKLGTNSATFEFDWIAPSSGKATIYVCGNAVNFNGNTAGDIPIPISGNLYPEPSAPADSSIFTGISKQQDAMSEVLLYPNPMSGFGSISYQLKRKAIVKLEIINIQGGVAKTFIFENQSPGSHTQIIDLKGVAAGVYFLRVHSDSEKISQKLLTVY